MLWWEWKPRYYTWTAWSVQQPVSGCGWWKKWDKLCKHFSDSGSLVHGKHPGENRRVPKLFVWYLVKLDLQWNSESHRRSTKTPVLLSSLSFKFYERLFEANLRNLSFDSALSVSSRALQHTTLYHQASIWYTNADSGRCWTEVGDSGPFTIPPFHQVSQQLWIIVFLSLNIAAQ